MTQSPYHDSEVDVQERSGRRHFADALASRIFADLTPEASDLFTAVPFVILGSLDELGRPWASILSGPEGFISLVDGALVVGAMPNVDDPLFATAVRGGDIGLLAINFGKRIRYRINGKVQPDANGFRVIVSQCYRNCPQYIHARSAEFVTGSSMCGSALPTVRLPRLDDGARRIISNAETFFIATHASGQQCIDPRLGADVSHRGGNAGFVEISSDGRRLSFPDYIGNFMFNTLGNLTRYPRCGLLFIEFESGQTVQVTGKATIDWEIGRVSTTPGAQRVIDVEIDEVLVGPATNGLRWSFIERAPDLRRYQTISREERPHQHVAEVEPPEGFKRFTVSRVVDEAKNIRSIYLRPTDGHVSAYKPGQHLRVHCLLPGADVAAIRHYSLSDFDCQRNEYRIGVRKNPDDTPESVSRHIHRVIQPGSSMFISDPMGDFVLDTAGERPVVLISAGVGVTPMLCMLKALSIQNPSRTVWFIHGARNGAEQAYASEVRRMTDRCASAHSHFRYSKPRAVDLVGRDHDSEGYIDISLIQDLVPHDSEFFICGPSAFMSELRNELINWSVDPGDIHIESFGSGSLERDLPNIGVLGAEIRLDGTEIACEWTQDARNLLALLEEAGAVIPYSCRSGACGTCEHRVARGDVRYPVPPQYPVKNGYALLCCAQPASDVTISMD